MKQEKAESFALGFFITVLIAVLIWFSLLTFSRMENVISSKSFEVFEIEKATASELKIVAMNKEYFFDIDAANRIIGKYSFYDLFIPSEIKVFFATAKASTDAVITWVDSGF